MQISVIIPVYNGQETIVQCLEALLGQDYPSESYEILIVNDGSTDNTRQIIENYPVRLINLAENCGRIIARERGAKEAKYDNLLFVDARVVVARDILRQAVKINYQPVMAGDLCEDKYRSPFDTLFYLIRRKVYAPYFPQTKWGRQLWIDKDNFDSNTPKGTTCIFCGRELFLKSVPQRTGKTVSDDILLLRRMVERRKLLRHTALRVNYLQRTDWKSVLGHIYQRGPFFNDYYLRTPHKYHTVWRIGVLGTLLFLGLGLCSSIFILYGLLALGLALLASALFLSENLRDFVIVLFYLPLIALTFTAGIIKGKFLYYQDK